LSEMTLGASLRQPAIDNTCTLHASNCISHLAFHPFFDMDTSVLRKRVAILKIVFAL
jgi:hypothetical protein